MILKINYKYINYMIIFIHLKLNYNLKMNLIFKKELYQEKVLLELLKNVLVIIIIFIMQLNKLNNKKEIQILKKYEFKNKLEMI